MLYTPDTEPIRTSKCCDIFIPPEGRTLPEADPWSEAFLKSLSTDGPRAIIFFLPSARVGRITTDVIFNPGRDLGLSTERLSISPIELLRLQTGRLALPEPIEVIHRERAFKAFTRLKIKGGVYLNGIDPDRRFIQWGKEKHHFDAIVIARGGDKHILGGAIRWSEGRVLILLPLPSTSFEAAAHAAGPIAEFYAKQDNRFWDGARTPSLEADSITHKLKRFVLSIPPAGYPTINGKELQFKSRELSPGKRYKKRLGPKHIELLHTLSMAPDHTIEVDDALKNLDCDPSQLNQIIHELREAFKTSIPPALATKALLRAKGGIAPYIRLLLPTE